jgi:putative dimethyl sulfoxide reductase chaperone
MEIHKEIKSMISGDSMSLTTTLHDELIETLVGEVLLLNLLGKALYEEPDRAWLETLIADQVFDESPLGASQPEIRRGLELLQEWSRRRAGGLSENDFREIRTDYTRLFIGLDTLPTAPWESVYFNRERLVFQEQTLQVREWYSRFGLQVEKLNREPDDHIGLEFLFISHLASLSLQAIENADQTGLDKALQAQRDFLSEHLLRWGPVWAGLVKQHAATDFYRGIAHLAHGSLYALAETLDVSMPKEVRA